ncbi:MAG: spore coat protein CotJB [Firmicutes bacterium]|nr:spore coat protein CotJB [Bacillota bacterium]
MLFDDNIGFITFDLNEQRPSNDNSGNILNPKEGFLRGNMYKDEYKPYKNYTYFKITPRNRKEQLLFEIMELNFAITDLNLYLDLHPNDQIVNSMFHNLVIKACEKELEYVNSYGPLELEESSTEKFDWVKGPWPWNDEGGSFYV